MISSMGNGRQENHLNKAYYPPVIMQIKIVQGLKGGGSYIEISKDCTVVKSPGKEVNIIVKP